MKVYVFLFQNSLLKYFTEKEGCVTENLSDVYKKTELHTHPSLSSLHPYSLGSLHPHSLGSLHPYSLSSLHPPSLSSL